MSTEAVLEQTAEQVEALLKQRLRGRVWDIRVGLRDGGLILQGRVPTYHVKQLAQHMVLTGSRLPLRANEVEVVSPQPAREGGCSSSRPDLDAGGSW